MLTGPVTQLPLIVPQTASVLRSNWQEGLVLQTQSPPLSRTPTGTRRTTTTQSIRDVTIPMREIQADIDPRLNVTSKSTEVNRSNLRVPLYLYIH